MKSVFESVGATYTQSGDYSIPDIALPKTSNRRIGKYGRMRQRHLKEHRPVLYSTMILDGTLWDHLAEIDMSCNDRLDLLISGMREKQGITEELKARDPMAWVGAMNNIRSGAEGIVHQIRRLCQRISSYVRVPAVPEQLSAWCQDHAESYG